MKCGSLKCRGGVAAPALLLGVFILVQSLVFMGECGAETPRPDPGAASDILRRMSEVYGAIGDYQMETQVRTYNAAGGVEDEQSFRYTFKKPNHIRIDMHTPYSGMTIIYPDDNGKVIVKPGGFARFLKLHLAPDNAVLKNSSGQRMDQTDLGLLIQNIGHSISDRRRGEATVAAQDGRVEITVLADDHFLAGVVTLYRFSIDSARWFPAGVKEYTPEGVLKRDVLFRDVRTSMGVPDSFFRINGGTP